MTDEDRGAPPVLTPYICTRRCADAIEWYREIFGAVESGDRYVDPDGRVGHASISIDGAELMLSDAYPDYGAVAPDEGATAASFALQVHVPDADATVAAAQRAGATVQRPVAEESFGERIGTLIDPFGVRWMIATRVREVTAADLAASVAQFAATGAGPGPVR